ncbi:head-tail adaptor protein [Paracoccus sp. p4-l81]|uniref:head-tail adaptor protein n=1 Tax=unclassified Paracoccus (in: a-proteobacteria) TaxID=2688777 RepID=UPI0035B74D66
MSGAQVNRVRLNRALLLEARERRADGMGGFAEAWVARGTVWAEVAPGTGRVTGGEFHATAATPYRITLRAVPVGHPLRPAPAQRLREGARQFRILAVSEGDTRGLYLVISAVEEVVA